MHWRLCICLLAGLVALANWDASADEIKTEHFEIDYDDISDAQARKFVKKAEKAFKDVIAYFGASFKKEIEIDISNKYRIPRANSRKASVTIPANRIRGDAGGPPRIRGRGPAIVHELTHVIVPGKDAFLHEGLGVYIQELFGNDKSYPNMGKDLHQETARLTKEYGKIISLRKAEGVRTAKGSGFGRSIAYLQEGSFVRHLIETHGLQKFMQVYGGKSYSKVYGKKLSDLEEEWVARIKCFRQSTNC